MASRMHFFTFLMALAVLFALASAAQLEDSPVSEGAVVPEVTEAPNKDLAKFSSDSLVAWPARDPKTLIGLAAGSRAAAAGRRPSHEPSSYDRNFMLETTE